MGKRHVVEIPRPEFDGPRAEASKDAVGAVIDRNGRRVCSAITAAGKPCNVWALKGEATCYIHSNGRQREIARRRNSAEWSQRDLIDQYMVPHHTTDTPPAPTSMQDVATWLSWIAVETAEGRLAMSQARTLTQTMRELKNAIEKADLEKRIEHLTGLLREAGIDPS